MYRAITTGQSSGTESKKKQSKGKGKPVKVETYPEEKEVKVAGGSKIDDLKKKTQKKLANGQEINHRTFNLCHILLQRVYRKAFEKKVASEELKNSLTNFYRLEYGTTTTLTQHL